MNFAEPPATRPIDLQLLKALPAATRVLEVGRPDSRLGHAYCELHRGCHWSLVAANSNLPDGPFDLLVLSEGLSPAADPSWLLDALAAVAQAGASLIVSEPNFARFETLKQLVEGDFSFGKQARHHYAPSTLYKRLLDGGWMPTLLDHRGSEPVVPALLDAVHALADAAGVPRRTAERTLGMDRLIVQACRPFAPVSNADGAARFTVVVPTTREGQLQENVCSSPGLAEVDARVVACRQASSPAHALSASLQACDTDWVLLAHQDVYFPRGFGFRLNQVLADIPESQRRKTIIGFAGMAVEQSGQSCHQAGFVIDRLNRADHPGSETGISIDELAIVISRDSLLRIDERLGWHLWATDLCLASIVEQETFPRIVRLPIFHNSLNDYELPRAFMESAAVLVAKYRDFGPIHTLCGTIDRSFLTRHGVALPSDPVKSRPAGRPDEMVEMGAGSDVRADADQDHYSMTLESTDTQVDVLMAQGRYSDAVGVLAQAVHASYRLEGVAHRKLYYPSFDRKLEKLAAVLDAEGLQAPEGLLGRNVLIATELYQLGGHSKVVEDLSRELADPVVVLTDLFDTYQRDPKQLEWIQERFKHAVVVQLPPGTMWEKCQTLQVFVRSLSPSSISYLAHHQDPIPYVATLGLKGVRKLFFHHGDHNPSLGCTLEGVRHVDLSPRLAELCRGYWGSAPDVLPMYVEDLGAQHIGPVTGGDFSVVTSGHPAKFTRTGPFSLKEIVLACLQVAQGSFFHIGPLEASWITEIRTHLAQHGIDGERFVHLDQVSSVWSELLRVGAAFYIGSAPVAGGRASVEAQGCGLPVLFFNGFETGPLLENYSLFAEPALGWASVRELGDLLRTLGPQHRDLSARARRFYVESFSRERYLESLQSLLHG